MVKKIHMNYKRYLSIQCSKKVFEVANVGVSVDH